MSASFFPEVTAQMVHDYELRIHGMEADLTHLRSELAAATRRMKCIEGFIERMMAHSAAQVTRSCNSPSWIGYNNAMQDCRKELEQFDAMIADSAEQVKAKEPRP